MEDKIKIDNPHESVELIKEKFADYTLNELTDFAQLYMKEIDFISVGFYDRKRDILRSYAIDPAWFKFIKEDDFMTQFFLKEDMVWKRAFKFVSTYNNSQIGVEKTLCYSAIDYSSVLHKEIISRRRKFNLATGVMLLTNHKDVSTAISFSSGSKKFSELDFAIEKRNLIYEIRDIVMKNFEKLI